MTLTFAALRWLDFLHDTAESLADKKLASNDLTDEQASETVKSIASEFKSECDAIIKMLDDAKTLFGLISPNAEKPVEAGFFSNKILAVHETFEVDISRPLEAILPQKNKNEIVAGLKRIHQKLTKKIQTISNIIAREQKAIESSARASSVEIQASLHHTRILALWGMAGTVIVALLGGLFGAGQAWVKNYHEKAQTRADLFSEYKVRLDETRGCIIRLQESSSTNAISKSKLQNLLPVIEGEHEIRSDARASVSWDRIIRDLQSKYNLSQNADNAAYALLKLKGMAEGSGPCLLTECNECVSNLNAFATSNGFGNK